MYIDLFIKYKLAKKEVRGENFSILKRNNHQDKYGLWLKSRL